MRDVTALGYIGWRATDLGAWRAFGTDILGMSLGMPSPDGEGARTVHLRMDERAYRIVLEAGATDELACIGLEVPGPDALGRLGDRLSAAGHAVTEDPDLAARRLVSGVLRTTDPGGVPVELFWGAMNEVSPFVSPLGVSFVVGELGIGHVAIMVSDVADSLAFYRDILGFRITDAMGRGYFLRCNPRHHTVAMAPFPGTTTSRVQHLLVQLATLDDVGRGFARMEDAGAPLVTTIGRHTNDHMVSFYVRTPGGFDLEYAWGGRTVDEATWSPSRYDRPSAWGHRRLLPHEH